MALWRAVMKIGVDSSEFEAGLKKVDSSLAKFGKELAGYFSVGAVVAFTQSIVNASEAIQDLSEQTGISTAEVQALQRAAARSGVELNQYIQILLKVKKAKAEAMTGDANAKKTFKTLGLNERMSDFDILRNSGNVGGPEADLARMDLMGIKAGKAFNSLKDLRYLGTIELISPETSKSLSTAKDDLGDIWTTMRAIVSNRFGTQFAFAKSLEALLPHKLLGGLRGSYRNQGAYVEQGEPKIDPSISAMAGADLGGEIFKTPTLGLVKQEMVSEMIKKAFSPIPSDALAAIGGGYGSGIDAGSREREMLMFTRKISEDIREIKGKIESVPTEAAP